MAEQQVQHDPERQKLKDEYIKRRGWWAPFWDDFLALDKEMFAAYLQFGSVPWKKGHIEPKVKEFIYIAINAATTHMYEPGLRIHLRNAFKLGATKEEIMEVYELVAIMGMHTISMGVPVLIDELQKNGTPVDRTMTPEQQKLKDEFIAARGWWTDFWDDFLMLDVEMFRAFLAFSVVPWEKGHIEPKVKEFIHIAIDAATTHMYEPGLRIHMRNALKYGATKEEIMEVFELVSILGMHTISMGVPVLVDELRALESRKATG